MVMYCNFIAFQQHSLQHSKLESITATFKARKYMINIWRKTITSYIKAISSAISKHTQTSNTFQEIHKSRTYYVECNQTKQLLQTSNWHSLVSHYSMLSHMLATCQAQEIPPLRYKTVFVTQNMLMRERAQDRISLTISRSWIKIAHSWTSALMPC